jgi:hypothetical protein
MRSSSAQCRVKFEELDSKHFYNIVSCNFMKYLPPSLSSLILKSYY